MHGLMSGDWKRSTVSGPQRLQGQRVDSAGPSGHRASPRLYLPRMRLLRCIPRKIRELLLMSANLRRWKLRPELKGEV
jgi:hypothetical protein